MCNMIFICLLIFCLLMLLEMGETAIVSLTKQQILAYHNEKFAERLINIKNNIDGIIVSMLLFDSILHFLLSSMIINFIQMFFGTNMITILGTVFSIGITFISMICKLYAIRYPNQTMFVSYWILYICNLICKPIIFFLKKIMKNIKHNNNEDSMIYKRELMFYLESNTTNSIMEEIQMMKSTLSLKDVSVNNIMTYKSAFIDIEFHEDIEQMKRYVLHNSHKKKIIVWQNNRDNILGTIDTREFLTQFVQNKITNIKYIIKPPKFFVDGTDIYQILQYFRKTKDKIVFIINEYGILLGVVTLTDIVNEIIGETDIQEEDYIEIIDKNIAIVDGIYYLRTLNKKMNWDLPEEYLTVSGFIMNTNHQIPTINSIINWNDYSFTIISLLKNKINRVLIKYNDSESIL